MMKIVKLFLLQLCIVASIAFTPQHLASSPCTVITTVSHFKELQAPSTSLEARLNNEDEEVNVVELEVDAFTLTAVGFGLIAFNFLVLANMGDGGIGGIVARIMNTFG